METVQTTHQRGRVADAPSGHWVYRALPRGFWPYAQLARWDRPIGWWLLLWPCWWSAALAPLAKLGQSGQLPGFFPSLPHLILFWIGAVAMRGAGCTYNDLVDRHIDQAVERTRSRPLPSGQVTPLQAKLFLVGQALVGLVVLLQFNPFSIALGLASLLPVAIYPFMKRITNWPQLFLGFAFSWGAWMGWAALYGSVSLAPALLYIGSIAWVIGYDTIYAHQDKEDDAVVGVRSTARLFGSHTRQWLVGLYGLALTCFACAWALTGVPLSAYLGLAAAALHMGYQIIALNIDDPDQCLKLFRSNKTVGWLIFLGLIIGSVEATLFATINLGQ